MREGEMREGKRERMSSFILKHTCSITRIGLHPTPPTSSCETSSDSV